LVFIQEGKDQKNLGSFLGSIDFNKKSKKVKKCVDKIFNIN